MGPGHTSKEQCGAEPFCDLAGGFVAAAAERVGKTSTSAQNVGTRVALFVLRFYKAYLSMRLGGTCRFEPSCSNYAYEAVERFGVALGSWLALRRLLRCHPLSHKFGYDPVPDATEFSPNRRTQQEAHS